MPGSGQTVYVANAPDGIALALAAPPSPVPKDDYAWTGSPAVEAFFLLLTVLVVPVAILRWTRRLRPLAHAALKRAFKA